MPGIFFTPFSQFFLRKTYQQSSCKAISKIVDKISVESTGLRSKFFNFDLSFDPMIV